MPGTASRCVASVLSWSCHPGRLELGHLAAGDMSTTRNRLSSSSEHVAAHMLAPAAERGRSAQGTGRVSAAAPATKVFETRRGPAGHRPQTSASRIARTARRRRARHAPAPARAPHPGEQVGIERELQHVLRVRLALQLGVRHLVGEIPERRRPLDPLEKVGQPPQVPPASAPWKTTSAPPASASRVIATALREARPRVIYLDDAPARGPERRQMTRLVGVAVALQELRVLAVLPRRGPRPVIRARSSVVAWAHPEKRMRSEAERRTPYSLRCISPPLRLSAPPPPEHPPAGRVARALVLRPTGDKSCHCVSASDGG